MIFLSLNVGFIPEFLDMIRNNASGIDPFTNRQVYVLAVFELDEKVTSLPESKSELVDLFHRELAVIFHVRYCKPCHDVPDSAKWRNESTWSEIKVL